MLKIESYLALKSELAAVKKQIADIEKEIISELSDPNKIEGSTTATIGNHKITITKKVNRSIDLEAYKALDLPDNLSFIEMKPSINLKKMRAVGMLDSDVVSSCITEKPGKPQIKIVEV